MQLFHGSFQFGETVKVNVYLGHEQEFRLARFNQQVSNQHCIKIVRVRSYSGPHFPAFGLNTERYSVSIRIQSECGKMQTRITPNTDTFHAAQEVTN